MKRWYAVATQPKGEPRAEFNLRRQGFETWLPRIRRVVRHARRTEERTAPLFPGYLFVRLDPDVGPWRCINGTFGVRHLVSFGERPAPVPESFIDSLRDGADADGLLAPPQDHFRSGMPVQILAGPFADSVGTLVRLSERDRVEILMNVLGRDVCVSVSGRCIQSVI